MNPPEKLGAADVESVAGDIEADLTSLASIASVLDNELAKTRSRAFFEKEYGEVNDRNLTSSLFHVESQLAIIEDLAYRIRLSMWSAMRRHNYEITVEYMDYISVFTIYSEGSAWQALLDGWLYDLQYEDGIVSGNVGYLDVVYRHNMSGPTVYTLTPVRVTTSGFCGHCDVVHHSIKRIR